MPTPGPTYTPAQQLENAARARNENSGPVAEIKSKESVPAGPNMESPATAQVRSENAHASEAAGLKQPADELSPNPKKA